MATLRTQPFGSRWAPANWDRATAFLQFILHRLFDVGLGVSAEDCFCAEPEATLASALSSVKAVCALLGLSLAAHKEQPPGTEMLLLGATVTIHADRVTAAISARRRNDYTVFLRNFLNKGTMPPADAAKVRGELVSAQSLMSGRYGSAFLQPCSARQYSKLRPGGNKLTPTLQATLHGRIDTLHAARPRSVAFATEAPVVVYTGAQGLGHVSALFFPPASLVPRMCHSRIPLWMRDGELGIGISEYEMTAAALGVLWAAEIAPGKPIHLRGDNKGADGSIVKGSCSTEIGRQIAALIWRVAAENACHIWVEYVKSALNPSDSPSRCCTGEVATNEFAELADREVFSSRFVAAFPSHVAITEFGFPATELLGKGWVGMLMRELFGLV